MLAGPFIQALDCPTNIALGTFAANKTIDDVSNEKSIDQNIKETEETENNEDKNLLVSNK